MAGTGGTGLEPLQTKAKRLIFPINLSLWNRGTVELIQARAPARAHVYAREGFHGSTVPRADFAILINGLLGICLGSSPVPRFHPHPAGPADKILRKLWVGAVERHNGSGRHALRLKSSPPAPGDDRRGPAGPPVRPGRDAWQQRRPAGRIARGVAAGARRPGNPGRAHRILGDGRKRSYRQPSLFFVALDDVLQREGDALRLLSVDAAARLVPHVLRILPERIRP